MGNPGNRVTAVTLVTLATHKRVTMGYRGLPGQVTGSCRRNRLFSRGLWQESEGRVTRVTRVTAPRTSV